MAARIIHNWLRSHLYAQINGIRVRPIGHPVLKEEPLTIQKGQAEVTCLTADTSKPLMLKKFLPGKGQNRTYLESVTTILPRQEAFIAGTERQILSMDSLVKASRSYYSKDMAIFLDGTILMPKIPGMDWSGLADDIREAKLRLSRQDRIHLGRKLATLVAALENCNCCHRDLSSGNIWIDLRSWTIFLIDFDSAFHPRLVIPKATTAGTSGYIPPYAWNGDILDAQRSWCLHADRYALGLLIIEFCLMNTGSPLTAEGGMFNQEELRQRTGPGIESVIDSLQADWPILLDLFDRTIHSRNYDGCPSPQDWQQVLNDCQLKSVSLDQIESLPTGYFTEILNRAQKPHIPIWKPPLLADIQQFKVTPMKKTQFPFQP